jgi:hypothetical protein
VGPDAVALLAEIEVTLDLPASLPSWTQLAAVAVGAVGGAAYAARRGFDVVGVLLLAVAAGLGGLLLRDTLLQNGTSIVLTDGRYLLIAVGAAILGFFFAGLIDRLEPVIVVLDALALGFLCTVGASAALSIRLSPIAAVSSARSRRPAGWCCATCSRGTHRRSCAPGSSRPPPPSSAPSPSCSSSSSPASRTARRRSSRCSSCSSCDCSRSGWRGAPGRPAT